MTSVIVMTGSSGAVGSALRPLLLERGHELRLVDLVPSKAPLATGEAFLKASILDGDAMTSVCEGADLMLHLGGFSQERAWEDILHVNIHGMQVILESARRAGLTRVLLASSHHAVGLTPVPQAGSAPVLPMRPDSFYGVSKIAMEALGSLYADRFGMFVVSARIGSFAPSPRDLRSLSTWFSAADCARLIEACLTSDKTGHHIVWGVSNNSRRWFDLSAGKAIGFHPQDNAELTKPHGLGDSPGKVDDYPLYIGGALATDEYPIGVPW